MLIHAAEQRVKNFNFFIIISSILIASYAGKLNPKNTCLIAASGIIVSILFAILDVRTLQIIRDARDNLEYFEPKFGLNIHIVDQIPDKPREKTGSKRSRIISHTFAYRAAFVLMGLLSLMILMNALFNF
jgi:hypothetical protein